MALGKLLAATAFEVAPRQDSDFEGGTIGRLRSVEAGLTRAATKGHLETGLPVSLRLERNRTCEIREAALKAAFGTKAELLAKSQVLAKRLGLAMDGRSDVSLLIVSVHQGTGASRQVCMWTFPRGQVLLRRGATINLGDAFILESNLRKAALLSGANNRTGFLTARVLDYQIRGDDRRAADFWILEFLDSRPQMSGPEGTSRFAAVLRVANNKLEHSPEEQEVLHTAIAAVRTHSKKRWSIADFATELLPTGNARTEVLKASKLDDERNAVFELDVQQFDRLIEYRVYQLDNGIRVSAPFAQVGEGVKIEDSGHRRRLVATGLIRTERLSRNG